MKKKLLGGLLVVAIAAVAAFNVNMNTQENELSLLSLDNVEALAGSESGSGYSCVSIEETDWGVTLNCYGSGTLECKNEKVLF